MRKRASRIDRVANRLDALPRPIGLRWSFLADRGVSVFTQLTGAHETYIFRHSADLQSIFPLLALVSISIGEHPTRHPCVLLAMRDTN